MNEIGQREVLIMFMIHVMKWGVYRLHQQLDRADFDSNLRESLDLLIEVNYITPYELFDNGHPSSYRLLKKGNQYLNSNFNSVNTLQHIKEMQDPDFLYEITEKWIKKSEFIT